MKGMELLIARGRIGRCSPLRGAIYKWVSLRSGFSSGHRNKDQPVIGTHHSFCRSSCVSPKSLL